MFEGMGSEDQENMLANFYSRSLRGESLLSFQSNKYGEKTPGTDDNSTLLFEAAKDEEVGELQTRM
jgi:hypothetical protein